MFCNCHYLLTLFTIGVMWQRFESFPASGIITTTIQQAPALLQSKDLDTAETFWNLFPSSGGRGYSGWGTSPYSSSYGQTYYPGAAYGGYYNNYGYAGYPSVASGYSSVIATGYPSVVGTGYTSGRLPTYENYAIHKGHGFGSYGNY